MPTGTLSYWDDDKYYGFIQSDDGKSIFVPIKALKEKIEVGDEVEFEFYENEKGYAASEVYKIDVPKEDLLNEFFKKELKNKKQKSDNEN